MLHIQKGNPWLFWPNHICDTFPEKPGNQKLSGEHNFNLTLEVKVNEVIGQKGTIFCILPRYTALDIYSNKLLFTITQDNNKPSYEELDVKIYDGVILKVKIEHIKNKTFKVFIDGKEVFNWNLEKVPFGKATNPHIIFGAGNFPANGFNLNYTNLELYNFTLEDDTGIISNHSFKKFIFDKSYDISDNLNFIHKI